MNVIISLAVMLLPFSVVIFLLYRRMDQNGDNAEAAFPFAEVPQTKPPILDVSPVSDNAVSVTITREQLEVIADALEFTGEYIKTELKGTEHSTEESNDLDSDLKLLNNTLGVVSGALESPSVRPA
jgi:hypothetical protein